MRPETVALVSALRGRDEGEKRQGPRNVFIDQRGSADVCVRMYAHGKYHLLSRL